MLFRSLYIAANSDLAVVNKTYNGSITDIQIYNRALTHQEIMAIYGIPVDISTLRGSHRSSRMTPPYNP